MLRVMKPRIDWRNYFHSDKPNLLQKTWSLAQRLGFFDFAVLKILEIILAKNPLSMNQSTINSKEWSIINILERKNGHAN